MKKRKTDLFRFVTLRTPELISTERKALGFIEHPDPSLSVFLSIIDEDDLVASRVGFLPIVAAFNPFDKVQEIKDLVPEVWEFSMWLAKNRNSMDRSEIDALIPSTLPPTSERITIWDNLHYDLITDKNPYVRQACLQVIVALNFIDNYVFYSPGTTTIEEETLAEAELLKRLANGKVIVHKVFGLEKNVLANLSLDFNLASRKRFKVQHKANLALCALKGLKEIRTELLAFEKLYTTDYNSAYEKAYDSYVKINDPIVKEYIDAQSERGATDFPKDLVEPFSFSFVAPLSDEYYADSTENRTSISSTLQNYIKQNNLSDQSTRSALEFIDKEIDSLKKVAAKTARRKLSRILVNGAVIKPNTAHPYDYAFSFEPNGSGGYKFFFSLDSGYEGTYLSSYSFDLTVGNERYKSDCPKMVCSNGEIFFAELFTNHTISFHDCIELVFTATIQLDNGKTLRLYKKGNTNMLFYCGAALVQNEAFVDVEHYGVNRIGVADYRRVEQELCCYIPGEVSHIENILAREYKEKISRNLTRVETSFESTSEREVEELSDTTSTTRHEMSSEISEVLQKDKSQNYGFDASVSGEYADIRFTAGGYGDFSLGQSSTDSNSQARTYAEDVTRRALERIVQKTTIRRSSKILKEFEETNKHGFDNREGTEHVTGVYRWIDKVYKNTIVNYGKRLMYEFMIPEPARWYKEAIIVEIEEQEIPAGSVQNTSNAAVMPEHPSVYGMNSAADVQRDNYNEIASKYGISASAPEPQFVTVSKSYSGSPGTNDDDITTEHGPLIVPQNYVGIEFIRKVNIKWEAFFPVYGWFNFSIGSVTLSKNNFINSGSHTYAPETLTNQNLEGDVNITASTHKITTYTIGVDLKCLYKQSEFEKWQAGVFDEIMGEYERQLQTYKDAEAIANAEAEALAVAAEAEEKDTKIDRNPRFNAGIVNTELKRLCIEMLTKPFGIPQGMDFYRTGPCDVPVIELSKKLDNYSSHVKFFEQAFDWDLLSQLFYPYYWAKKCDWKSLFQSQDGVDYIFQQFLQSGMARVIVPVREGFEDAVTFFMETGKIWSGTGMVIDTEDDLYVSIVDEMTIVTGRIDGEEWETIVPSSLTLVQDQSVKLEESGLPCCETNPIILNETNLSPNGAILTGEGQGTSETTV